MLTLYFTPNTKCTVVNNDPSFSSFISPWDEYKMTAPLNSEIGSILLSFRALFSHHIEAIMRRQIKKYKKKYVYSTQVIDKNNLIVWRNKAWHCDWSLNERSQNCEERQLALLCLSVGPSEWKTTSSTGRIFMKFDIWVFSKICRENSSFIYIWH